MRKSSSNRNGGGLPIAVQTQLLTDSALDKREYVAHFDLGIWLLIGGG